jgi:hypothetical protein
MVQRAHGHGDTVHGLSKLFETLISVVHPINNVAMQVQVGAEAEISSAVLAKWHLLSLDAPTVAAAWTWFVARASGVALPWESVAAMFVAVWVLYAADRLLDERGRVGLEERHLFHRRHGRGFRWGIAGGCAVLAVLLPRMNAATIRLDVVLGVLLVAWFVLIHSMDTHARPLPKEFVLGLFFAAAIFVPLVARRPEMQLRLVLPAVLFGALCCLNCLFIFAWEHEGLGEGQGHRFTLAAVPWVVWLASGLAACSAFCGGNRIAAAAGLSAGLLVGVHMFRERVDRTTLRALADLALLTPLVLGWWR